MNAFAHRTASDPLIYECPNCEFGEVLMTEFIEPDGARCFNCGTRYRLSIETMT